MAFSLIPKNDAYFDDFDQAIRLAKEMAHLIRDGVAGDTIPPDLHSRAKAIEHSSDDIVRRCLRRLDESFITPIEREDIHMLIVHIDEIIDKLEGCSSRFDVYGISTPTQNLRAMVGVIVEITDRLVQSVSQLRTLDPAAVREQTERVHALEEEVDSLHRTALRELFARRPEAHELIALKEIYEVVEDAADFCLVVARSVEHILVRHS